MGFMMPKSPKVTQPSEAERKKAEEKARIEAARLQAGLGRRALSMAQDESLRAKKTLK
jgi:hypothetical protein